MREVTSWSGQLASHLCCLSKASCAAPWSSVEVCAEQGSGAFPWSRLISILGTDAGRRNLV